MALAIGKSCFGARGSPPTPPSLHWLPQMQNQPFGSGGLPGKVGWKGDGLEVQGFPRDLGDTAQPPSSWVALLHICKMGTKIPAFCCLVSLDQEGWELPLPVPTARRPGPGRDPRELPKRLPAGAGRAAPFPCWRRAGRHRASDHPDCFLDLISRLWNASELAGEQSVR